MQRSLKSIGSITGVIFDIHNNSTKDTVEIPCLFMSLFLNQVRIDITKGPTAKVEPYML